MRKNNIILVFVILLTFSIQNLNAQTGLQNIACTGYNKDIVANANGNASASTNAGFNGSAVLIGNGFNSCTTGLFPSTLASHVTSGLTYILQSASGSNSLTISNGGSGTLTLLSPVAVSTLYFLGMNGSNPNNVSITVTFTDNSTETASLTMPRYTSSGNSNAASDALSGTSQNSSSCNLIGGIYLQEIKLTISTANVTKNISSISFTNMGGLLHIMAIGGEILSIPKLTPSPVSLTFGCTAYGSSSAEQTFTLAGSNLTSGGGTITIIPPTGFQISTTSGSGYTTGSLNIPYTGTSLSSTTIYAKCVPTAPNTSYSGNIIASGGGVSANIAVSGSTVSPTSLAFGFIPFGSSSAEQSFTLTGNCLTAGGGPIIIIPPAGFQISTTSGSGYTANSLNIPYTGTSFSSTTIYVKFIPTASNTSYSGNITASGGGISANVAVTGNSIVTYCPSAPLAYSVNKSYISGVNLPGYTSISSMYSAGGYADYTSKIKSVMQGQSFPITIITYTNINYSQYRELTVSIDYNFDGIFTSSEIVYDTPIPNISGTQTFSTSITVPLNTIIGITRMRIVANFGNSTASALSTINPCWYHDNNYYYGETEDYSVNIFAAPSPTCTTPTATPVAYCQNTTAIALLVTATAGSSGATISNYAWYCNNTASNSGGILLATHNSSATTDAYTPVTSTTGAFYYYVIVTNSSGSSITSNVSGPVTINSTPLTSNIYHDP
jgi:hypothetical protein